jgi:hypothetical protein
VFFMQLTTHDSPLTNLPRRFEARRPRLNQGFGTR